MRQLFAAALLTFSFFFSFSQQPKVKAKKYPSLLWEITGKGLSKPSYLFGTMHVSNKMAFHLSDSFYLGIKNADVVALETNPETWQEDMSKYDMTGESYYRRNSEEGYPSDYLTINSLKFLPYEKLIALGLNTNPAMINSFLYRSYETASDFEEDTYLDLYIFQLGRKWGKKVSGVENFDESMQLMKEAYADASKEKNNKRKSYDDYEEDFSSVKLQEAYRTGNLDWLDTINQVNSSSAAFDEKFLYKRNEIQAASIDSILKTKQTLFVGVGAAHLPGQRGVIEMLRRKGYKLRPIKMGERNSEHKEAVEKIRVPVQWSKTTAVDSMFSASIPGKLYSFMPEMGLVSQQQYADMANGSYYVVTRLQTNSTIWGHNTDVVYKKVDSLLYENIPGKMLSKKEITRNGFKGFEVMNRTRRGDYQRYNIFVTPFEIILFKMSGNGDYVKDGKEADHFFNSIELKPYKKEWKAYSPTAGGFEAEMPHQPIEIRGSGWQYAAYDKENETIYNVFRTDIHNYQFVEEDSFDLALMEESFGSSDFIEKQLSRKQTIFKGYPALDAKYKHKDGSLSQVKFLIKGPHYYTVMANSKKENPLMAKFINSFTLKPFHYGKPEQHTDTSLYFTVKSPLPLEKKKKMDMGPGDLYSNDNEEQALLANGVSKNKLVQSDSTGEKIYLSFNKEGKYYYDSDTTAFGDTTNMNSNWAKEWVFHQHKVTEFPNKAKVWEYVIGSKTSSRAFRIKYFLKDGVYTSLTTQIDTISAPSAFISSFYESFMPADTVKGTDISSKKSGVWFTDFFSKDTTLRKQAILNVYSVHMDSTDFPRMKEAVQSLTWKDKKYLDTKKSFITKLSLMPTTEAAGFLKQVYYAAGDTLELQYVALQSLLKHKTAYAYSVFKDILLNEPPVLNINDNTSSAYTSLYTDTTSAYDYENYSGSGFMDRLFDSTKLTATIFKDILPLVNVEDYEWPILYVMADLIDSNLVKPQDYEMYFSKFLIEAKQAWKKQQISEKNRLISKAKADEEKNERMNDYYRPKIEKDGGNDLLSFYARLLIPFWDQNPAVPQLLNQFLNSNDKQLKYKTALLMLRNKKMIPDTLLKHFASLDEYRYDLYTDLETYKLQHHYPITKFNLVDLAKSRLLTQNSGYNQPDTIVYADKLPLQYKGQNGFVYFFKYKSKKDDVGWKIGSVGMVPADGKSFEVKSNQEDDENFDFTWLSSTKLVKEKTEKEQFQNALKKMLYEKRKSAANFYVEKEYGVMDAILGERF